MSDKKVDRLLKSQAYKKAQGLVSGMLDSPQKLIDLVSSAQGKTDSKLQTRLEKIITPLNSLLRLLKAYAKDEYRDISIESLALIVASIIYFIMPIDVIPDFILMLGHADDAVLIGWTIKAISKDLDKFLAWEELQEKQSQQENQTEVE